MTPCPPLEVAVHNMKESLSILRTLYLSVVGVTAVVIVFLYSAYQHDQAVDELGVIVEDAYRNIHTDKIGGKSLFSERNRNIGSKVSSAIVSLGLEIDSNGSIFPQPLLIHQKLAIDSTVRDFVYVARGIHFSMYFAPNGDLLISTIGDALRALDSKTILMKLVWGRDVEIIDDDGEAIAYIFLEVKDSSKLIRRIRISPIYGTVLPYGPWGWSEFATRTILPGTESRIDDTIQGNGFIPSNLKPFWDRIADNSLREVRILLSGGSSGRKVKMLGITVGEGAAVYAFPVVLLLLLGSMYAHIKHASKTWRKAIDSLADMPWVVLFEGPFGIIARWGFLLLVNLSLLVISIKALWISFWFGFAPIAISLVASILCVMIFRRLSAWQKRCHILNSE